MDGTRKFDEIIDHPAFADTYQGGLRAHLERLRKDMEETAVSSAVDFARLQERVRTIRWVLEEYPLALTGGGEPRHHSSYEEEEDAYKATAENPAFAD